MEGGSPAMGATEFATRYVPALAGTWVWARGRGRAMSLTRDSRPKFLPQANGPSIGHLAPIVRWSSLATDVGLQVAALSSHASRLWLRVAASACGIGDALAGIPGRGRHSTCRRPARRSPPEVAQDPLLGLVPAGDPDAARRLAGRP